jgi:inorganic triphosphatase YgiF
LRQLLANEDCALAALSMPGGGDLAAVRHIRYALRRLRHGLDLFEPVIASPAVADFVGQCSTLGHQLGPARHWAVLASALRQAGFALAAEAPPPGADTQMYRVAADSARTAILAPEFTRLVLACGGWLEHDRWSEQATDDQRQALTRPFIDVAPTWLDRLLKRARKTAVDTPDLDAYKRQSRRLRRLFDAADCCRGLFPPSQTRPFMAALADLRDPLDQTLDLTRARALLPRAGVSPDSARDALLGRRLSAAQASLPDAWRRFKQAAPFWVKG